MINLILWLLFGGFVGWVAGIVMRTDKQQGTLLNIVVGIVGSFLGGFLFNLLGIGGSNINNNDFSLSALLISFVGAVILLWIVNLVRRVSVRGSTPPNRGIESQSWSWDTTPENRRDVKRSTA
jgi:uncharacterized membrane protein YeaQ/YmgE (transglycosylase-associated protein family)